MNQRIKELAEQATTTQGATRYNPLTHQVFDREKFAELIVQDCVDIFNDDSDNLVFEIHNKISRDKIKQHFGVES